MVKMISESSQLGDLTS